MLQINRIREYQVEIKNLLLEANGNPLFGYTTMVVDDSQLSKVLRERSESDNSMLISIVPDHVVTGDNDALLIQNAVSFFILNKTAYSEHDHDSFINIFSTTQQKALAFVKQLLKDKDRPRGSTCSFLSWLNPNSITIFPVWGKDGCNGWQIDFNLLSRF
jgi:hypothetical protein